MISAESNSEKSVSYQKKDNDKDLEVCFLVTRVKWTVPEEMFIALTHVVYFDLVKPEKHRKK